MACLLGSVLTASDEAALQLGFPLDLVARCREGEADRAGVRLGLFLDRSMLLRIAAIGADSGLDRMLGFNLKDASGLNDTALGRIGLTSAGA